MLKLKTQISTDTVEKVTLVIFVILLLVSLAILLAKEDSATPEIYTTSPVTLPSHTENIEPLSPTPTPNNGTLGN